MKKLILLWWQRMRCHHDWKRDVFVCPDGFSVPLYSCHCTKCGKQYYFDYGEEGIK